MLSYSIAQSSNGGFLQELAYIFSKSCFYFESHRIMLQENQRILYPFASSSSTANVFDILNTFWSVFFMNLDYQDVNLPDLTVEIWPYVARITSRLTSRKLFKNFRLDTSTLRGIWHNLFDSIYPAYDISALSIWHALNLSPRNFECQFYGNFNT